MTKSFCEDYSRQDKQSKYLSQKQAEVLQGLKEGSVSGALCLRGRNEEMGQIKQEFLM